MMACQTIPCTRSGIGGHSLHEASRLEILRFQACQSAEDRFDEDVRPPNALCCWIAIDAAPLFHCTDTGVMNADRPHADDSV